MSSNFTVIYDACVLYPAPLRDLLMRLALADLYRARWTDMIHDEWTRNVRMSWQASMKALLRVRAKSIPDAATPADGSARSWCCARPHSISAARPAQAGR